MSSHRYDELMGYCSVGDVQAIVDTDMAVSEIQDLIDEADAFIATKLTVSGVNTKILRAISRTWTAYRVMVKDPASESLDGHSENRTDNLNRYEAMYKEMLVDAGKSRIAFTMTSSPIV